MKVTVNVDCTPEEARSFLGLPDVQPLQEAVMAQMQERMLGSLKSMDPEVLLRTWGPMGMNNLEQIQKFFFSQFPANAGTPPGKK
ncbi:hypothetical protein FNB15_06470 [Ferrovibrio terrae]|uniref:Ribosomal protein S1 n=1 Tax=Ferrovibrio terrae TaxID=2594003 RepID=A0A516H028_9PROT|nr:DUF6489 family protein [Ferrovibrio terrae]QDO96940.1 hypothetical protein FNB15_06470 [Ferrovibrio terrae]